MTVKYYVDPQGVSLGSFDGAEPPPGSIEVPFGSNDGRDIWDFENQTWIPYVLPPEYRITVLSMRARFTAAEKVAINLAALDDPGASAELRLQSAQLRVALADLAACTYSGQYRPWVDLTRPDTQAPILLLETLGLLADGRANEIITTPAQQAEFAQF